MVTTIKAGLLIDGTGTPPAHDVSITIEGGRIGQILPGGADQTIGPEVFDASDCVVIPGMIDTHAHLASPSGVDLAMFRVESPATLTLFYAAQAAQATLAAGFTTLRNMGGVEMVHLKQAIDRGLLPGPRLIIAGMIFMTGGHTDRLYPSNYNRGQEHVADGVDEVTRRARKFVLSGIDFIKVEATGGMSATDDTPNVRGYSDEELAAAANVAHGFGKRLAVHAHSAEGVRRAVEAGADTVEHCTWADEEALERVAERGAFITATCSILEDAVRRIRAVDQSSPALVKLEAGLNAKLKMLADARRLGVKVVVGTDACGKYVPHGQNALEFELLCRAGFSPMESLSAGTRVAAEALGLQEEVGTLEPGKRADLVVLRHNPLDDIALLQDPGNVLAVFKDGLLAVDWLTGNNRGVLRWPLITSQ
jgi:imidazolonepropionase-like amidohydrolase